MKQFRYLLLTGLMTVLLTASAVSENDIKLERSVIGSGGTVNATNSEGVKLSGIVGQVAIEKITYTTGQGKAPFDVYQGFWTPIVLQNFTDVETPVVNDDRYIQNYPNPFNSHTTIKYSLPGASRVTLRIFDASGRKIIELLNTVQSEGVHQIEWDVKDSNGADIPSGSYLCELSVNPAQVAGRSFKPYSLRTMMVVVK